jgi:7,8-dihydropterin-6-yl-methyl-4-(beta-D-ribofuranosyl)aminobenzene 5'-phosphate synthase
MEAAMRVTTLIENERIAGRDDLVAEFGLCLHIEAAGARILFDTGSSGVFADNAKKLGVDLSEVDVAVLSHHHFDHGGGLERFLEVNPTAPIYLRESQCTERQFRALAVLRRPIGIDCSLLDRFPDRFRTVADETEIAPGVHVLTDIPEHHPRPAGNRHLFAEHDGVMKPDPFDHELVLAIQDDDGLVVFTGCSHSGILNMIDGVVRRFPGVPVRAVFGGFHLFGLPFLNTMAASRDQVRAMASHILDIPVGQVYTGHCTGAKAFRVLGEVMGDRLRPFPTGTVVEV